MTMTQKIASQSFWLIMNTIIPSLVEKGYVVQMISSQNLDIDGQGDSNLTPPPSLVNPMFSKNVKMTFQFHISGTAVTTGSTSINESMNAYSHSGSSQKFDKLCIKSIQVSNCILSPVFNPLSHSRTKLSHILIMTFSHFS